MTTRISNLTDEEITGLSADDLSRFIDLECALAGAPLLPPNPGPEPEQPKIIPALTLYGLMGVYFKTAEDAAKMLGAIEGLELFDATGWGIDRTVKRIFPGDYSYPQAKPEQFASPQQLDDQRVAIAAYKKQKAEWDSASREYQKATKARESVLTRVNSFIEDARTHVYEQQRFRADFARYLDLANGDPAVAMNFLTQAKPAIADAYPDLVQELCPGYGAPTKVEAGE